MPLNQTKPNLISNNNVQKTQKKQHHKKSKNKSTIDLIY